MTPNGADPDDKGKPGDLGPLDLPDSFVQKNKKKGLAALLALLFGGKRRDALLIALVGGLALIMTGIGAVTGKLSFKSKAVSPEQQAKLMQDRLKLEAELASASEQAAKNATTYGMMASVDGKARSSGNDALAYLSHNPKEIQGMQEKEDTEEQKKAADATVGPVDPSSKLGGTGGLAEDSAKGLLGKGGAGSLSLASAGAGLLGGGGGGGGGMSVADNRKGMTDAMLKKHGNAPDVKPGQFSMTKDRQGRLGNFKATRVNARITDATRRMKDVDKNTRSKSLWQLVRATAYTMSSLCTGCNRESVAVYNRAYATGEAVTGVGLLILDESAVPVDHGRVNKRMSTGGGGAADVAKASEDCSAANQKHMDTKMQSIEKMSKLRWEGNRSLSTPPSKCCKVRNYNDKVSEYRDTCKKGNAATEAINKACGGDLNAGKSNCGQYKEVDTCGWFKCWFMFILMMILTGAIGFAIGFFTFGAGAAFMSAAGGMGAMGLGVAAMQMFAPDELPWNDNPPEQ